MTPDQAPAKRRIFLVDDHPLVCEGLTIMINRQIDLVVCGEAGSAQEALQAIEALRPDAALVDLGFGIAQGSACLLSGHRAGGALDAR